MIHSTCVRMYLSAPCPEASYFCSQEKMGSDHHCERGMCSHHSTWMSSSDRLDSEKSSTVPVHGPHPGTCSRENPLLQTPTPAEVISPLEKKKRMAQASLTVPASGSSEDGAEPRPSVIQISPACPSSTRTRHSSDGSPLPVSSPSGSLSRSPSPYSVSSEDCIAVSTQKSPVKETESKTPSRLPTLPTSKAGSNGVCKPLSCYPNSKDLANYHYHYREFLQAGPHHSEKTQRNLSWTSDVKSGARLASHRLPSPVLPKACWVPHPSSFSKVPPRETCRSVSLQHTYKPHMSYHPHLLKRSTPSETYLKTPMPSQLRMTDRKDKAKTMLPKPLPTQQYLLHPHGGLTMPYLPTLERPRGDLAEQLKALPLQPVLLPTHLTIPQTHSMHCPPMGTPFPGSYEPALPSYPYPFPIWHPPNGYNMTGMQPY